jgi:hypothetical protein
MRASDAPQVTGIEVVATETTKADRATLAIFKPTERRTLPGAAYIVKVRLKTLPEPTSRGFALYVGDLRIPKYWTYRQGIWFKVFDPQFFVEHKGEPIRFSLNDTEFVDTRLKLTCRRCRRRRAAGPRRDCRRRRTCSNSAFSRGPNVCRPKRNGVGPTLKG